MFSGIGFGIGGDKGSEEVEKIEERGNRGKKKDISK